MAAVRETSGRSRTRSLGIPVTPDCHEGFGIPGVVPPCPPCMFPALAPPLPAARLVVGLLSLQTSSGTYEMADSCTGGSVPQYLLVCPPSLNMVPPTATLNGVDARRLTEMGCVAGGEEGSAQPSAPLSPVDTK